MAFCDSCRRHWILCSLFLFCVAIGEVFLFSRVNRDQDRARALRYNVLGCAVLFFSLCSRYVWLKLAPSLEQSSSLKHSSLSSVHETLKLPLLVALFLVLSLGSTSIVIGNLLISHEPHWLSLTSSFCMGVLIFMSFGFCTTDIAVFIWSRAHCSKPERSAKTTKASVKLSLALSLGLALVVLGVIGASKIRVENIFVPIKGLSPRLNGTTLVQLSDIHLGPFIGRQRMEAIVKQVNKQRADLVLITGDLVDSSVKHLWGAVEPLVDLKATHGVYYCTGNHEYYTGDVDNWIRELPKVNIKPLVNDHVCLFSKDTVACHGGLYLAGIEDYETRRMRYGAHTMDIHRALSGRQHGIPTIVLAHQPMAAAEAVMWDDVRLVLSGHTHAGQILPMMLPVYLYNPFFAGLYNPKKDVYVYVSAGTSSYHIPFRHYRPEITRFTLISVQ